MRKLRSLRFKSITNASTVGLAGACFVLSAGRCGAEVVAKELPEASVVNEVQTIKQADLMRLSKPFVVNGATRFDGWFVVSEKVIFKSGSQLIFTRQAQDKRRNFYIVTRELVSEDANAPGTITYEQPTVTSAPAKPGQGPTGAHAREDGHHGGQGSPGDVGAPGPKGFSAPALTITVMSVPSSGPAIDFRGAVGGEGGQGQKGGDGGNGAKGSPASQSMFDCKAGGGRGGNGGRGGIGGAGGAAGVGGDGGNVTIIAPAVLLPSLSQKFRVLVAGGPMGKPGAPGRGGNGGQPGPGGQEAKPYCGGGPSGDPGGVGPDGLAGQTTGGGTDGDFFVGAITPEMFNIIYK